MSVTFKTATSVEEVEPNLLVTIMAPYKKNCKYLKSVRIVSEDEQRFSNGHKHSPVGLVTAKGEFSISDSCYIDDTGHFNSVEFHICYNQFIYVLLAYCVENRLLDAMKFMDLDEYKQRQLPDILLAEFSTSFKRPIKDSGNFHGMLTIRRAVMRGTTIFIKSHCTFYDDHNGFSEGDMLLAIVDNSPNARSH